ncbi:hypothetical protein BC834DRAFT_521168 [Gloeopeniophorella convolvens]|nr:hypothetical protein BC834DRAFT_521168 [Gloeopeniophorella convolvens]
MTMKSTLLPEPRLNRSLFYNSSANLLHFSIKDQLRGSLLSITPLSTNAVRIIAPFNCQPPQESRRLIVFYFALRLAAPLDPSYSFRFPLPACVVLHHPYHIHTYASRSNCSPTSTHHHHPSASTRGAAALTYLSVLNRSRLILVRSLCAALICTPLSLYALCLFHAALASRLSPHVYFPPPRPDDPIDVLLILRPSVLIL